MGRFLRTEQMDLIRSEWSGRTEPRSKTSTVTDFVRDPKGPVGLGNPKTCAETKLCLNFILFRLKK